MANYASSGRRSAQHASASSQFIDNLNSLPFINTADANSPQGDDFNPENLAIFANTDFFDFDMGESVHQDHELAGGYDPEQEERARRENASRRRVGQNSLDYMPASEFHLPTFPTFPDELTIAPELRTPDLFSTQHALPSLGAPKTPSTILAAPHSNPILSNDHPPSTPFEDPSPTSSTSASAEPVSAVEDKRRRNTAASARFRQKKKEREAALERSSKDIRAKCEAQENEIRQLRQENLLLKSLITEKMGGEGGEELWRKASVAKAEASSKSEAA
ncbi:MAG: hypothetical protein M1814_001490 [Vezdaea aestivalis]|nr:MAG: hypothetical protein M1814_001490 [Vezdaea aestivalis]